ncbi:hypothetical protein [Microcoleus sp. T3_D1]|uniref:hypothetical protein n=1 Tax=Microcoleus sp. T3_D1 TaxID=3055427 RepID=UPI002FCF19A8
MTKAGKVQSSIVRQEIFINADALNWGQIGSDRGVGEVRQKFTLRILTKFNLTMHSQATEVRGRSLQKKLG